MKTIQKKTLSKKIFISIKFPKIVKPLFLTHCSPLFPHCFSVSLLDAIRPYKTPYLGKPKVY